jgi:hypothetical protein
MAEQAKLLLVVPANSGWPTRVAQVSNGEGIQSRHEEYGDDYTVWAAADSYWEVGVDGELGYNFRPGVGVLEVEFNFGAGENGADTFVTRSVRPATDTEMSRLKNHQPVFG